MISLRVQPTEREKAKISEPMFIFVRLLRRSCSLVVKPTVRAAMKASTPFSGSLGTVCELLGASPTGH